MKKVFAWVIGAPFLAFGVILLAPFLIAIITLETAKWAMLNISGDYRWGS